MDKIEAQKILAEELSTYRCKPYQELAQGIGESRTSEKESGSGVQYQVQIQLFWDDRPNNNIRVQGAIDDGGIRVFFPLSDSFIMNPKGEFIDE